MIVLHDQTKRVFDTLQPIVDNTNTYMMRLNLFLAYYEAVDKMKPAFKQALKSAVISEGETAVFVAVITGLSQLHQLVLLFVLSLF